jgi:hypothetical protein
VTAEAAVAVQIKQYIGDGVHVEFDGFGLMLSTERMASPVEDGTITHFIYLEPDVYLALTKLVAHLADQTREP